jgi:hypothetical protein
MQFVPATTRPVASEESRSTLTVTVLFTDVPHTLSALREAAKLGNRLHASLQILMPVVVPYPLELMDSPVHSRFLQRRLVTVVEGAGIPTRIHIAYCRDRDEAVKRSLPPNSIVVVCWRRFPLFDSMQRLTKCLTKLGHHVVAAPMVKGS